MRNEREKYNDTLVIWEMLGGLTIGLFTLGLPFILWYVFKFINFIQSENFKMFLIGFSLCPLWVFTFLKIHKVMENKRETRKNDNLYI